MKTCLICKEQIEEDNGLGICPDCYDDTSDLEGLEEAIN